MIMIASTPKNAVFVHKFANQGKSKATPAQVGPEEDPRSSRKTIVFVDKMANQSKNAHFLAKNGADCDCNVPLTGPPGRQWTQPSCACNGPLRGPGIQAQVDVINPRVVVIFYHTFRVNDKTPCRREASRLPLPRSGSGRRRVSCLPTSL